MFKNMVQSKIEFPINYFLNILNHEKFSLYFSLFYALLLTLSFYPGILYTDSVPRWNLSIEFYNNGFLNFSNFPSHHPVIPSIIQSFFYGITKEIGLFIFLQVFSFSYLVFKIIEKVTISQYKNLIITIILILPINYIYALFHSFDTIYAILNLLLILIFFRIYDKYSIFNYIALLITIFLLVSIRLNAILLSPIFALLFLYFYHRIFKVLNVKIILMSIFILVVAYLPFYITSSLNMKTSNSWVIGFAWEYANLGTKSNDNKHIEFMTSLGANTENIKNKICYNGIWCGNEFQEFIVKVALNDELSKKVLENYFYILKNEPKLFITEKLKYISSVMGISKPLQNAEIGRWREYAIAESHKKLGFITSENKEKIIDNYFTFSKNNTIIFEPYKIFILGLFFLLYILFSIKKYFIPLTFGFLISWLYYSTFFITSQNHELRYFFPVLLYSEILLGIVLSDFLSKFSVRKVFISISIILIFMIFLNKYYIYQEKKDNFSKNIENTILLFENNGLSIKFNTQEQKIIYFYNNCENKDLSTQFFLHLYSEDINNLPENKKQYKFDNLDFTWSVNKVETPFFGEYSNSCLAVIYLPKYKIKTINTGQYNAVNRLWQTSIDLTSKFEPLKEFQSFNLTDANWRNGISLGQNGFFIENNFLNRQSLQIGDKINFSYSGERTIVDLIYNNQYINIFVDGEKLDPVKDGYPNKIKLVTEADK